MPVPKRKRSRSRRDKRFANKGIKETSIARCAQEECGFPLLPHQACKKCGFYKGAKVIATKADRGQKREELKKVKAAKQPTQETQE
ncbi:MAG: 50S ribosomal protein L32 [Candidatus Babeliales bacterium]